jgi:hypothetical protein
MVRRSRLRFIFNLKFILNRSFLKWHPSGCVLSLNLQMEEDFPQSSFCSGGIRFCSAGNKTRRVNLADF